MTGVSTLRTCVLASAGLLLFTACSEDTGGGTDSGAGTTGTQSSDSDDGLSHGGPGDGMDGPGDGESTDSSAGVTDDGVDETRGGDHATTDDDTTTGDDATTGEDTTGSEPLVPASSGELITWLEAGSYLGWTTESAVHDSA
ncbi:MAG: hypothetical protein JKY37_30715, partial [Nannocystaceae bacterium]|nr:hypothetical protein [Nannocystaceae bacterium]